MKKALVNGRWQIWLPNSIADWDAVSGDPVARRGWEYERFESFRRHLRWDDSFFDVGAEHGWISAIIAREFVNPEAMVLFEPSPEFWGNIRRTWVHNNIDPPLACFQGFVADHSSMVTSFVNADAFDHWPTCADLNAPEVGGMAYRSLANSSDIPSITLDDFTDVTLYSPSAINIDVEGAELMVLRGAVGLLTNGTGHLLRNVWVSIHPDLMENFGHTPEQLREFMSDAGWMGRHLGTDHEEHWHFERAPFSAATAST